MPPCLLSDEHEVTEEVALYFFDAFHSPKA
jgi:hypothetical protein